MTQISATVVAHSINEQGDELVTMLLVHPRIILAELNTHRMFSRNSASSRAIPFKKMVKSVQENPFIPIAWQKEHKGMQGREYLTGEEAEQAEFDWIQVMNEVISHAKGLNVGKVTKQLCNRLLEPFMWHTTLVTTGKEGLENFFNLRCPQYGGETFLGVEKYFKSKKEALKHLQSVGVNISNLVRSTDLEWQQVNKGQAEIHIMALAEAMYDAYHESKPEFLKENKWHIPFGNKMKLSILDQQDLSLKFPEIKSITDLKVRLSTAMCARTSYTKVGDEIAVDYAKLIDLHNNLIVQDPLHASPMEHIARCMNEYEYETFAKRTLKNFGPGVESGWCYNFRGFIPYRYFLDNKIDHECYNTPDWPHIKFSVEPSASNEDKSDILDKVITEESSKKNRHEEEMNAAVAKDSDETLRSAMIGNLSYILHTISPTEFPYPWIYIKMFELSLEDVSKLELLLVHRQKGWEDNIKELLSKYAI